MTTLADTLRPAFARAGSSAGEAARWARIRSLAYDALLVLAGSALMAASARVAFPLPFSPVPVTGQTFAVLLVGALLGSRRGAASALSYLAEGAAGLPVFSGGAAGPQALMGPTGGYLMGFVLGAWLCGALSERGWDRRAVTTVLSMILGNIAIFAVGIPWLAGFVGAERVLALGLVPFIAGDVLKIGLAAVVLPLAWKWIGDTAGCSR